MHRLFKVSIRSEWSHQLNLNNVWFIDLSSYYKTLQLEVIRLKSLHSKPTKPSFIKPFSRNYCLEIFHARQKLQGTGYKQSTMHSIAAGNSFQFSNFFLFANFCVQHLDGIWAILAKHGTYLPSQFIANCLWVFNVFIYAKPRPVPKTTNSLDLMSIAVKKNSAADWATLTSVTMVTGSGWPIRYKSSIVCVAISKSEWWSWVDRECRWGVNALVNFDLAMLRPSPTVSHLTSCVMLTRSW